MKIAGGRYGRKVFLWIEVILIFNVEASNVREA